MPTNALVRTLSARVETLLNAAKVIAWTDATYEWLKDNDPKALEQLIAAIEICDPNVSGDIGVIEWT